MNPKPTCHICRGAISFWTPKKSKKLIHCSSCKSAFCERCIGKLKDTWPQNDPWRCILCSLECCCSFDKCTKHHSHCATYRQQQKEKEKEKEKEKGTKGRFLFKKIKFTQKQPSQQTEDTEDASMNLREGNENAHPNFPVLVGGGVLKGSLVTRSVSITPKAVLKRTQRIRMGEWPALPQRVTIQHPTARLPSRRCPPTNEAVQEHDDSQDLCPRIRPNFFSRSSETSFDSLLSFSSRSPSPSPSLSPSSSMEDLSQSLFNYDKEIDHLDIFTFVYGFPPLYEEHALEFKTLLNCPSIFRTSVPVLLAFHEWLEHEYPEDEDDLYYYWKRRYPLSNSTSIRLPLPKSYFRVTPNNIILLKNEHIKEWIQSSNSQLLKKSIPN